MLPSSDEPTAERSKQLRRWGPLAAIGVVAVIVLAVVIVSGGGGDDDGDGDAPVAAAGRPEGAISWTQAQDEGLDVTFPDTCDTETGRVAMPFLQVGECFADVDDNGGATSPGVTADSIKVVVYIAQEDDAVLNFITAAIDNDDTNQDVKDTYQGYVDMFNDFYQTYGRTVDVEFLDASGGSEDEVAARADAVKAAEEMGAFAVWGGPVLTSAFADELAARGVSCVGCLTGGSSEFYEEHDPYIISSGMNADQVQIHLTEYLSKKIAGRPAEHAGDEAYVDQERNFGFLWIEANDTSKAQSDKLVERLGEEDIELAENVSFVLDPARLQEQATSIIAQLKAAGVTSVIFSGDPVSPATFTQEATAQDYFPEWILGPQTLVDTTAFSRTYDQEQWAHAFGPSPLVARFPSEEQPPYALYEWYTGETPPAADTNGVLFPNPSTFYAGLQAAGPDLTPETFQAGLFSLDPEEPATSFSSASWGEHDLWPYVDYNGTDDVTEIWWDPEATGPDEIRKEGTGMWRYVDGGERYLPGEWTDEDSKVFDPEGSVTIFDAPPEGEAAPEYPSP